MTKIIKLTEVLTYSSSRPKLVNVASIQTVEPSQKDNKDTHIKLMDKSFFFVKENVDEVWEMVRSDKVTHLKVVGE
jgi:uncharacterized protein YlzI (FlbEa/FlbD family)